MWEKSIVTPGIAVYVVSVCCFIWFNSSDKIYIFYNNTMKDVHVTWKYCDWLFLREETRTSDKACLMYCSILARLSLLNWTLLCKDMSVLISYCQCVLRMKEHAKNNNCKTIPSLLMCSMVICECTLPWVKTQPCPHLPQWKTDLYYYDYCYLKYLLMFHGRMFLMALACLMAFIKGWLVWVSLLLLQPCKYLFLVCKAVMWQMWHWW